MKKIGAVFMAVIMMFSLCACGNSDAGRAGESAGGNGQAEIGWHLSDGKSGGGSVALRG